MNPLFLPLFFLPFLSLAQSAKFYAVCDRVPNDKSFYSLETTDLDGKNRTLQDFAGNITLVVNLATFWGNLKFNTYNEGNLLLDRYQFGKSFVISLYMAYRRYFGHKRQDIFPFFKKKFMLDNIPCFLFFLTEKLRSRDKVTIWKLTCKIAMVFPK